eukprot:904900-Alexandrium_andersonii.AAC.1
MSASLVGSEMCIRDRCSCAQIDVVNLWPCSGVPPDPHRHSMKADTTHSKDGCAHPRLIRALPQLPSS